MQKVWTKICQKPEITKELAKVLADGEAGKDSSHRFGILRTCHGEVRTSNMKNFHRHKWWARVEGSGKGPHRILVWKCNMCGSSFQTSKRGAPSRGALNRHKIPYDCESAKMESVKHVLES